MTAMGINEISSKIIKAAITVHTELGPGLLESVYKACMLIELKRMQLYVKSEVTLPIVYRKQEVEGQVFRLDLLLDNRVIVELKSVIKIEHVHKKQLLTYLRLAQKHLGLLINFNDVLLKDGIARIINTPKTL